MLSIVSAFGTPLVESFLPGVESFPVAIYALYYAARQEAVEPARVSGFLPRDSGKHAALSTQFLSSTASSTEQRGNLSSLPKEKSAMLVNSFKPPAGDRTITYDDTKSPSREAFLIAHQIHCAPRFLFYP